MAIQPPNRTSLTEGICPQSVLHVRFAFPSDDSDARIFAFSASGPAANTDKLKGAANQIDSHPEWSDSEVSKVLSDSGAQFGPADEKRLLDNLPVQGLRLLLGEYHVQSARFTIRDAGQMREHRKRRMTAA